MILPLYGDALCCIEGNMKGIIRMVEFDARKAIEINRHVDTSHDTGVQQVLSVSCLVNTGEHIIDGSLAVVMDPDCNGYTVRVDDSTSGVPIGQIRSQAWTAALGSCVSRINQGQTYCPVYVQYDAI